MPKLTIPILTTFLVAVLALGACAGENSRTELDKQLRSEIGRRQLTGDPSSGRDLPQISDPLAQLGLKLFFTKALAGDNDVACASCHHPLLGGGDALSLSVGVGADDPDLLGPGRTHPAGLAIPRNAPTVFNAALWDQVMFHDGRIESLAKISGQNGAGKPGIRTPESSFGQADPNAGPNLAAAQSRFPVIAAEEMKGDAFKITGHLPKTVRTKLIAKLTGTDSQNRLPKNDWLPEFQSAFKSTAGAESLITEVNIFNAIGEYERSLRFVGTPWKAYVQGDDSAITESAKRGALLFFQDIADGGAGCAQCHSGDFFTDEQFHVLAVPQVGLGKGDGPFGDGDFGRFRASGSPADLYAFRTPTLLNVEVTSPYGHSGAYTTLEGIVRHHLNPDWAVENYDAAQLDPTLNVKNTAANTAQALAQLDKNRRAGLFTIQPVALNDKQIQDLISFLLALTDPCVKDRRCLAPWLPSGPDPDGIQLKAKANFGRLTATTGS